MGMFRELLDASDGDADAVFPVEHDVLGRLLRIAKCERDLLDATPSRPIDIGEQSQTIIDLLRKAERDQFRKCHRRLQAGILEESACGKQSCRRRHIEIRVS